MYTTSGRRQLFSGVILALASASIIACGEVGAAKPANATPEKADTKKLAAGLQQKTVALIDAINSKDTAAITRTKSDLSKEADKVEDALKSETGQAANQVNSAVTNIRAAMTNNNVDRLTTAKDQLQRAQQ